MPCFRAWLPACAGLPLPWNPSPLRPDPPLIWPLPNWLWMLLASCDATACMRCSSHAPRPADFDLARAPFCAMAPPPLGSGMHFRAEPRSAPL
eukprot:11537308-Heterocapsa_arctica.AAC.1